MHLQVRHTSLSSMMDGLPNDNIILLDYRVEGKTLWQMIMSIKSSNPITPGNIYHAIGQDWK